MVQLPGFEPGPRTWQARIIPSYTTTARSRFGFLAIKPYRSDPRGSGVSGCGTGGPHRCDRPVPQAHIMCTGFGMRAAPAGGVRGRRAGPGVGRIGDEAGLHGLPRPPRPLCAAAFGTLHSAVRAGIRAVPCGRCHRRRRLEFVPGPTGNGGRSGRCRLPVRFSCTGQVLRPCRATVYRLHGSDVLLYG